MSWFDIAFNNSVHVRVGANGAIQTNPDPSIAGNLWTNRTSGVGVDLRGVAWTGFSFIAVGHSGTVLLSEDDGLTWLVIPAITTENLYDVDSVNPIALAVGANGTLIQSPTGGYTWTALSSGTANDLWGVSIFEGEYTAVGDNDTIVTGPVSADDKNPVVGDYAALNDLVSTAGSRFNVAVAEAAGLDEGAFEGLGPQRQFPIYVNEYASIGEAVTHDVGGDPQSGVDDGSTDLDVVVTESCVADDSTWLSLTSDFGEGYWEVVGEGMFLSHYGSSEQWRLNEFVTDNAQLHEWPFDSNEVIREVIGLADTINSAFGKVVAEGLTLDDTPATIALFNAVASETLTLDDQLLDNAILYLTVSDGAAVSDTPTPNQILQALVTEGLVTGVLLSEAGEVFDCWVMNTETRAMTRYDNFKFESLCSSDIGVFATDGETIFELTGSDDDGASIAAEIEFAVTDFGTTFLKRVTRAYLGLAADGRMILKTITDRSTERWYELSYSEAGLHDARIKMHKGVKSKYWSFKLANADGSDFELDSITFVPMVLNRRVR